VTSIPAPPSLIAEINACRACGLAATRRNPVVGIGDGRSGLLIVGEAPGAREDETGVPFVGRSGSLLRRIVTEELGLTNDELTISNMVRCRPPMNRTPTKREQATCRPFMDRQLEYLKPRVIVTVGNTASQGLLGRSEGITSLRGRAYEVGCWTIVPTFHPAAALRGRPDIEAAIRHDVALAGTLLGDR
jgi:DNA polymerase